MTNLVPTLCGAIKTLFSDALTMTDGHTLAYMATIVIESEEVKAIYKISPHLVVFDFEKNVYVKNILLSYCL